MKPSPWLKAIEHSSDPQRARHYHKLLVARLGEAPLAALSPEQAGVLVSVLSGSQFLADWLLAHSEVILEELSPEHLRHARRAAGFLKQVGKLVRPALATHEFGPALARLREFKQREMLRIAARDLGRLASMAEITRELSDLADACLEGVWQLCRQQFADRFGRPYHPDTSRHWRETPACVLGLGKLGGQELNYSSDVDLLLVYADEGQVFRGDPNRTSRPVRIMSSHQYFNRLAESFIAEVTRLTPEGALFRVDLRLRPEGETGPLCRSLESYENYYAQWGQTWERLMLIKARSVAGDVGLAHEFTEMIQPFRYPRSLPGGTLLEVAATKTRLESEVVKPGELKRNVKLGRGGIREIEFIVQSLQLLHAGRQPFLQTGQTLACLGKLAQHDLLPAKTALALHHAYVFLRDVEHRLQMEANRQTHTIPEERAAQARLARLMGFVSAKALFTSLGGHQKRVRATYDHLFAATPKPVTDSLPPDFEGAASWQKLLATHGFRDPTAAFRVLKEFALGPGYVHVSQHTTDLARALIPKILTLCPLSVASTKDRKKQSRGGPKAITSGKRLSDPDRVLTRLDSFITAYGARAPLYELWNRSPAMFELLLLLFDRSEFLAERAIRTPDLVDALVTGERLTLRKSMVEILADLRHGRDDADQFLWLRRYHEAEQMRLGLRDILGLVDYEQNCAELSALAIACMQYAVEVVMRESHLKTPPFAVVGLGKLGGQELNYGSDLDVLFVADAHTHQLPRLQKFAARMMDLLSRRTEQGIVFIIDARLRPDGEKGLLVNTLTACENYYRQRAQLWEIQALTRAHPVAGDHAIGEQFVALSRQITDFRVSPKSSKAGVITGSGADWKQRIQEMRSRVEKERTRLGQDALAIKTGSGGLMDAEFMAQALCLKNGWHEPNALAALERGRDQIPNAKKFVASYRQLRKLEGILRRWSYEGETVLPDDPPAYYRVAIRCGFDTAEAFRTALAEWRKTIRAAYRKFFSK